MTPTTQSQERTFLDPESGEHIQESKLKELEVDPTEFGLKEIKEYVYEGEKQWLTDDEYESLSKEFDLRPAVTVKKEHAETAQLSKAKRHSLGRDMGYFEIPENISIPTYIGDQALGELEKELNDLARSIPADQFNPRVPKMQERVDELWSQVEKQKALGKGYYPLLDGQDPIETTNRNLFYLDKLKKQARVGVASEDSEIQKLYLQLRRKTSEMAYAQKAGAGSMATDLEEEINSIKRQIKARQKDLAGDIETVVESIEGETAQEFLRSEELAVYESITALDTAYEEYEDNQDSYTPEQRQEKTEEIRSIEQKLDERWEKLGEQIDENYGELSEELSRYEGRLKYHITQRNIAIEEGNGELQARHDQEIEEAERLIALTKKEIEAKEQMKLPFLKAYEDGKFEEAAQITIDRYGMEPGGLPGNTALEKARYLYAITISQINDITKERYGQQTGSWTQDAVLNELTKLPYFSTMIKGDSRIDAFDTEDDEKLGRLIEQARALAPIAMLNRAPQARTQETAWGVFSDVYAKHMLPGSGDNMTDQQLAQRTIESLMLVSKNGEDYRKGIYDELEEISSPYDMFSAKDWAQMTATSGGYMTDIVVAEAMTGGRGAGIAKTLKNAFKLTDKTFDAGTYLQRLRMRTGRGISNAMFSGLEEGARFEVAGQISGRDEELSFTTGFFGGAAAAPVQGLMANDQVRKHAYTRIQALFGNKTPEAVAKIKNMGTTMKVGGNVFARPFGEVVQEYGEEIGGIYEESNSWKEVREKFEERFGTMSQNLHFAVSSAVLGFGMGMGTTIGDIQTARSREFYSKLSTEEKKQFVDFLGEINDEWNTNLEEYRNDLEAEERQGTEGDTGTSREATQGAGEQTSQTDEQGVQSETPVDGEDTRGTEETPRVTPRGPQQVTQIAEGENTRGIFVPADQEGESQVVLKSAETKEGESTNEPEILEKLKGKSNYQSKAFPSSSPERKQTTEGEVFSIEKMDEVEEGSLTLQEFAALKGEFENTLESEGIQYNGPVQVMQSGSGPVITGFSQAEENAEAQNEFDLDTRFMDETSREVYEELRTQANSDATAETPSFTYLEVDSQDAATKSFDAPLSREQMIEQGLVPLFDRKQAAPEQTQETQGVTPEPTTPEPTTTAGRLGINEDAGDMVEGAVMGNLSGANVVLTENDNEVTLESISVPPAERGKGKFSSAMSELIAQAKTDGKDVVLTPKALDDKTDQKRLEAYYESLGFKKQADGSMKLDKAYDPLEAYVEKVEKKQGEDNKIVTAYEGEKFSVDQNGTYYNKKGQELKRIPNEYRTEYFLNHVLPNIDDFESFERKLYEAQIKEESLAEGEDWRAEIYDMVMSPTEWDTYIGWEKTSPWYRRHVRKDAKGEFEEMQALLQSKYSGDGMIGIDERFDPNDIAEELMRYWMIGDKNVARNPERVDFINEYGIDPITNLDAIQEGLADVAGEWRKLGLTQEQFQEMMNYEAESEEEYNEYLEQKYQELVDEDSKTDSDEQVSQEETKEDIADRAIAFIEKLQSDIDKFGKENIGMQLLPPNLVKGLLEVVKQGLIAGKKASEIIKSVIKALKESDWYKSQTRDQQIKAERQVKETVEQNLNQFYASQKNQPGVGGSQSQGQGAGKGNQQQTGSGKKTGGKKPENNARNLAKSFGNKVEEAKRKNGNPTFRFTRKGVTVILEQKPNGTVQVFDIRTTKSSREKGKAKEVLKELTAAAEKRKTKLSVKTIPPSSDIDYGRLRDLFSSAGFEYVDAFTMDYIPGSGVTVTEKKAATEAIYKMFYAKISKGATAQDLAKEIDAHNWHDRAGTTRRKLKELAEDMERRIKVQQKARDKRVSMRVRGLYDRLLNLEKLTAEEREAIDLHGDILYEQLKNDDVNQIAQGLLEELKQTTDGSARQIFNEYMATWKKMAGPLSESRVAGAVHANVLHKIVAISRKDGDKSLMVEVLNLLAVTGTNAGRLIQQFSEKASPEAFANRVSEKMINDMNEAIGDDANLLEELADEIRSIMRKLFDSEISIDQLLERIASQDAEIAALLEKLTEAEGEINEAIEKENEKNRKGLENAKSKPNRSASDTKKINARVEKAAGKFRSGEQQRMAPGDVMADSLMAFAKEMAKSRNTLKALDAAMAELKKSDAYKNATPDQQMQMRLELEELLTNIVPEIDKDIKRASKFYIKKNEVDVKKIIEDHLKGNARGEKKKLSERIADQTGITDLDLLERLEKKIEEQIEQIVKERLAKAIQNKYEKSNKKAPKNLNFILQNIIQDLMSGVISDFDLKAAFAQHYNFQQLNDEIFEKIEHFAQVITELSEAGNRIAAEKASDELRKILREETSYRPFWGKMVYDYMHLSILSGFKTQWNAFIGAISEMLPEMMIRTTKAMVKNPAAPMLAIDHMLKSGVFMRSWKGLIAALKANENDVAKYGFYVMAETARISEGQLDEIILEGYKRGKPIMTRIMSVLMQPLRIVHALGAQDVFMNGTASEYLEYLDEFESQAGQSKTTWMQRLNPKVFTSLHKDVVAAMQRTNDPSFEQRYEDALESAEDMFADLGIKLPVNFSARLKQDMLKQAREEAGMKVRIDTIKEMMLMANPRGLGAHILKGIKGITVPREGESVAQVSGRLFLSTIMLLPRIMVASTSRMMSAFPLVGLASSFYHLRVGKIAVYVNGDVQHINYGWPEFWRRVFWNAAYTGITLGLFMSIFEFDDEDEDEKLLPLQDYLGKKKPGPRFFGRKIKLREDRIFDVTGELGGYFTSENSAEEGIKPLTLRMKINGKWRNITRLNYLVSFAPALHMMGEWRDELTYGYTDDMGVDKRDLEDSDVDKIADSFLMMMGEMTYSETLRTIKRLSLSPEGQVGERIVGELVVKPATIFTPRIYRDGMQSTLSAFGTARYENLGSSDILRPLENYYTARWMFDTVDKVDEAGYPLEYGNHIKNLPVVNLFTDDYWTEHTKGKLYYDLWQNRPNLMATKIQPTSFTTLTNPDISDDKVDLEPEEKQAMTTASRMVYGKLIELTYDEYGEKIESMTDAQFMEYNEQLQTGAKELVKDIYFYLRVNPKQKQPREPQEAIQLLMNPKEMQKIQDKNLQKILDVQLLEGPNK